MSSRQRSRFNKNALDMMAAANAESSSEEESSDDIEVSKPPVKVSNFAQFVDSSSESESSSSDESDHSVPKVIVSAAAKKTNGNVNNKNKKGSLSKDLDDFDEILEADMAVETQTLKVQTIDSEEDSVIKVMNSLFHIDVNELNVDKILQQRFGVNEGNQNNAVEDIRFSSKKQEKMYNLAKKRGLLRKNKSGGSNLGTSMLRFVFGQPPASFQKPPSYIGGGYSMSKCSAPVSISSVPEWEKVFYANTQWYRIDWSADYIKLHVRYSAIQASGDVNELLMFLSQNPHQLDALIQLGMVFARTGQMDKASDLFKRCICYLECSFLSSFEPWKDVQPSFNPGNSRSPQNSLSKAFCRVDANSQENIVIFSALFRHMQISLMLGCPTVALNIALVILSLDPLRDPFYMLLFLDHLLVTSRRFDLMDLWYSNATDVNCKVCFILGTPALNEPGGSSSITNSSSSDSSLECVQENEYKPLSISDALPNWAYSHAISCFLHLEQIEKEHLFSSSSDHSADSAHKARSRANEALKNAVKRWPFLMTLLLDKVSGDPAGAELNWEKLLSHKLIKDMKRYSLFICFLGCYCISIFFCCLYECSYIDSDSVLLHVAEIYVARNISLWKNKSVLKWVHSVLSNLLLKVETQRVHTVFTSENSGVSHSEGLKQHVRPLRCLLCRLHRTYLLYLTLVYV